MKALLIKEFRENLRWLPVGLLVFSAAVWFASPSQQKPFIIVDQVLMQMVALLGPLFAAALGTIQSAFDLRNGPRAYLQCRGVSSKEIVFSKIISGFAIYTTSMIVPIMIFAIYLNAVGLLYYPVIPLQVAPGLLLGFASFIFFPAAILILARPASWWGTRLLPLAFSIFIVFIHSWLLSSFTLPSALGSLCLSIISTGFFCWVALDAWSLLSTNPSGGPPNPATWRLTSMLVASSAIALIATCLYAVDFMETFRPTARRAWRYQYRPLVDAETGEPWIEDMDYYWSNKPAKKGEWNGAKLEVGVLPKIEKFKLDKTHFHSFADLGFTSLIPSATDSLFPYTSNGNSMVFHRGFFLYYTWENGSSYRRTVNDRLRLKAIIAADGIYPAGPLRGKRFENINPAVQTIRVNQSSSSNFFFVDSNGLYQIRMPPDEQPSIANIVPRKMDCYATGPIHENRRYHFQFVSNGEFFDFELVDESGNADWAVHSNDPRDDVSLNEAPALRGELVRTIKLPRELDKSQAICAASFTSGYVLFDCELYLDDSQNKGEMQIFNLDHDGTCREAIYTIEKREKVAEFIPLAFAYGLLPVAVVVVSVPVAIAFGGAGVGKSPSTEILRAIQENPMTFSIAMVVSIVGILISMFIVARLLRSRSASRVWMAACIPLGMITPLAIIAIYPRLNFERCSRCSASRRIDQAKCSACSSVWERAAGDGIEIVDSVAVVENRLAGQH